jgi:hypothetical protein
MQVEIGDEARHEDEIERTLADHLIGDPHLSAASVSGLDRPHASYPARPDDFLSPTIAEAGRLRQHNFREVKYKTFAADGACGAVSVKRRAAAYACLA